MKYLRNVFYSPRTLMHVVPPTIRRTRIHFFFSFLCFPVYLRSVTDELPCQAELKVSTKFKWY